MAGKVFKWTALSMVLVLTLTLATGCSSGVSVKVMEKRSVLGIEMVTAYVSGFKNDETTWETLQNFGDNYSKNSGDVLIYFFNDKNQIPSLQTFEGLTLNYDSDGVVAVYERSKGDAKGLLTKASTYAQQVKQNTEKTEQPKPKIKTEEVVVNYHSVSEMYDLEITCSTVVIIDDPSNKDTWTLTGTAIIKNLSSKSQAPGKGFFVFDEIYGNKFNAEESKFETISLPPNSKTRGSFRINVPRYLTLDDLDFGLSVGNGGMTWDKLTSKPSNQGTVLYTATVPDAKLILYKAELLPQDKNNKLEDDKQYLMLEVKVQFASEEDSFAVDSSAFGLISKDGFAYPQVPYTPSLASETRNMYPGFLFWRGQIFFAVPKNTTIADYNLTFTYPADIWGNKETLTIDLAKVVK